LKHHAVIRSHNEDGNVRGIGSAHTHGCESLMSRCIKEGDLLSVDFHHVGADMLCNTACLSVGYVSVEDGIQKRGLSVVNMAHNADHRRTFLHLLLVLLLFLEEFLDHV